MVSLTRLSPFCNTSTYFTAASPNYLKIEKLEEWLRLCGKLLAAKLHENFPERDVIDSSVSLRVTPVHKSSAFWIAGTEWRNHLSCIHPLDTNICLILLLLTCAFLASVMMYCDKSFLRPTMWFRTVRPMCVGRPFASSPFRRPARRCPSFYGFSVGANCDLFGSMPDLARISAL